MAVRQVNLRDDIGYNRAKLRRLPLLTVNHVSYAVPIPSRTAYFFEKVLGFRKLKRPSSFENAFDGAWLCGLGMEIHLIQERASRIPSPSLSEESLSTSDSGLCSDSSTDSLESFDSASLIDPRSDHLSFLCHDFDIVTDALNEWGVKYIESEFEEEGVRQLFFREPSSGIVIEVSDNPKC